jgi:hypothetical protein
LGGARRNEQAYPIRPGASPYETGPSHGWRKWTREELIAHIIDSSELLVDDKYISKEWVDSLLQTAQPPTDKLPAVKNHYYYVKLKPRWRCLGRRSM